MAILFEQDVRGEIAISVAKKMVTAARTAPKARGFDLVVAAVIDDKETMKSIANRMKEMVAENRASSFFVRDADNLLDTDALVLVGTKIAPTLLDHCGMCGFANCDEKAKHPEHPCAFNTGDLGIAIGSAVSIAADERVDNRVMWSIGMAVRELELLGDEVKIIYAIPLSITGKSIYANRKPKK